MPVRMAAYLRILTLLLFGPLLIVVPLFAWADEGTEKTKAVTCTIAHFTRLGGTELFSSVIHLVNGDLKHPATIERLTIRDFFGNPVHDSGPQAGVPHPFNTDFSPPVDITVVPPGASYYLWTVHIWGADPIPPRNSQGFAMSTTVQWSKEGKPNLFRVHVTRLMRERGPAGIGAEKSRTDSLCFGVKEDEAS
jgi:hypothetical protein